jgi:hypothetical protein
MERLFKNSRKLLASLGVVAFLMVAGWQVGADGTGELFSETEVALDNAKAGSGTMPGWNIYIRYATALFSFLKAPSPNPIRSFINLLLSKDYICFK